MAKGNTMDDFIVQLGWNDKKALAGLKAFMKKVKDTKVVIDPKLSAAGIKKEQKVNETIAKSKARAEMARDREVISERQRLNKAERKRDLDADKIKHRTQLEQAKQLDERNARKQKTRNFSASSGMNTLRSHGPEGMRKADKLVAEYHRQLARGTKTSQAAIRGLNAELRQQVTLIKRLQSESRRLNSVQRGMGDSMNHLVRSYASIFAVFAGVGFINRTGQGFESINSSMLAAMGDQAAATEQIEFLDRMTDRLGISLLDTADSYAKFAFSSQGKMPIEEVQDLFTGISELGTVLGITKDRMKLSMNAITQIK